VIVVGCGPTGAVAANLLGLWGLRTLVVERETTPFAHTRAIAIDEDGLRVLQSVGLLEAALADMRTAIDLRFEHRGRVFLRFSLRGRARQGLPGTAFFHQPRLEQVLRDGLARFAPHVRIASGCTLVGIEQDSGGVTALIAEAGQTRRVRARFLLGCDGGSSTTRRLLGIRLLGRTLPEPWIDIQARTGRPEPADTVLGFTYVAEPARPAVDCASPLGHHRWEFRLAPGETPGEALTPDGVRRLLATRGVDARRIEIVQSWSYLFHAREAERWQASRVFLCGDAAHLMPPYAGQGLSSGLRDVASLCWKLAAVARGAPRALLASYQSERQPNLRRLTRLSLLIGAIVGVRNPALAGLRDMALRLAAGLPGARRWIADYRIKPDWICGPGLLARRRHRRSPAGHLLWQPRVRAAGGDLRLDEAIGPGWAFLSWQRPRMPRALRQTGLLREIVVQPRAGGPAACPEPCLGPPPAADCQRVVDIEDRLRRQFRRHRVRAVLVRPDRFIYGGDRDRLDDPLLLAVLRAAPRAPEREGDGPGLTSRSPCEMSAACDAPGLRGCAPAWENDT